MSNDWLNDLRRKMEDHTEEVPDGLWEDIKNELFEENDAKGVVGFNDLKAQEKAVSKTNYKTFFYRAGGIAAAVAMFFVADKLIDFNGKKATSQDPTYSSDQIKANIDETISYHQKISNEKEKQAVENAVKERNELIAANSNIINVLKENVFNNILNKTKNAALDLWNNKTSENQSKNQSENILSKSNENLAQGQNKDAIEGEKTNGEEVEKYELLTKEEKEWKEKFEETKKLKLTNKSKKSWMVGILSGNASSNSTEQFPGYATLNGTTLSLPDVWGLEYGDDPLMAILIANQDKKVDAKIKHKTPITFGASVYHGLGKKWGIATGINYTKLSAELTTGTSSNFITSEQNIHYVGVPVQVNYNVIQKGAFTGYVTGGGLVEKAVSGDIKTKYIVDGVLKEETKEEISEKPVQVSVNSAVGLQLKVIKNIGIYAEPGVSYHFNDNSSLNTVYKEKPLNFNLKFGIRVLLD